MPPPTVRRATVGDVPAIALPARAEDDARELDLPEVRRYTNLAMTENLTYHPRHCYVETGRGQQDGYQRVFYAKRL